MTRETLLDLIEEKNELADICESDFSCTYLNPYSYLVARRDLTLFQHIDFLCIDGIALVMLLKLIGIRRTRLSFDMTSVAPSLFDFCINNNKSIFLIGSRHNVVANTVEVFSDSYPNLNIVGFQSGYIQTQAEEDEIQSKILSLQPDYVVCGMGTPKQESFLVNLKAKGYQGGGFTCGDFINQTSKKVTYYPPKIDKLNLRFLYRMYDRPKLIKRYLIDYPTFLFVFFYDLYHWRKNRFTR